MSNKKDPRGGWNKKYRTKAQAKKASNKQRAESAKKHTTIVNFRFHNEYDKDILEQLSLQSNKAGYIKRLIRDDISKGK